MLNLLPTITDKKSFFMPGRLSIGVYVTKNNRAVLIDSGIDERYAKDILKMLKQNNLVLDSVINTHYHADHCGGNEYLQKHYKESFPQEVNPLKIYATKDEKLFFEKPELVPSCFCGFAEPFSILRNNKQIQAAPAKITSSIKRYADQEITIDDEKFRIITFPGHTHGMIGVITPDNVLYCGDALFGEGTYDKHAILFYANITDTLKSFDKLEKLPIDGCVMYHGGYVSDIKKIVSDHRERLLKLQAEILQIITLNKSISYDQITQQLLKKYEMPSNPMTFTLTRTVVIAFVTKLENENACELFVNNNVLVTRCHAIDAVKSFNLAPMPSKFKISFSFANNHWFTYVKGLDNTLFNSISYIVDYLKHKAIIANSTIKIVGAESTDFEVYKDKEFTYNKEEFGDVTSNSPKFKSDVVVQLSKTGFSLVLEQNLKPRDIQDLENMFTEKLKLTLEKSEHKVSGNPALTK